MELLRLIGEKIGIVETPERQQRLEEVRELVDSLNRRREEEMRGVHMLAQHSDACMGEIEYVLGISNRDPHPNHPITFNDCSCPEYSPLKPTDLL